MKYHVTHGLLEVQMKNSVKCTLSFELFKIFKSVFCMRRWKDNFRMDLKEIGINTRKWADSAQDRDY